MFQTIATLIILIIMHVSGDKKEKGLIYILLWTSAEKDPFNIMGFGTKSFSDRHCLYRNCFLTNNTAYFKSVTEFDVILFNAENLNSTVLPTERSKNQLYIFFSLEPAQTYPLSLSFDGYFNLTWTYKLDSNATISYIKVKNKRGEKVAPKKHVHWIAPDKMKPKRSVEKKFRNKSIAAAWFVSNCRTKNKRLEFAKELSNEMLKYGLRLDIYGECGNLECPKYKMEECDSLIEQNYYFYLAFENCHCEDYVTEKVLHGLQHYAVPIVYGGANYNRFLPPGSYLNANLLGPFSLAKEISEIIRNKKRYYNFFKWHTHYSINDYRNDEDMFSDGICNLCAMLNNAMKFKLNNQTIVFNDIVHWWNTCTKSLKAK